MLSPRWDCWADCVVKFHFLPDVILVTKGCMTFRKEGHIRQKVQLDYQVKRQFKGFSRQDFVTHDSFWDALFSSDGQKCCNTTIWSEFSLICWSHFQLFCWTYSFCLSTEVSQTIIWGPKTVGPTRDRKVAPPKSQKSPQQFYRSQCCWP